MERFSLSWALMSRNTEEWTFLQRCCAGSDRFFPILVEADGSTYEDRQTYDLIFSNEVVQNFDLAMLESHIALARKMLAPEGRLIIGSVLWRRRRWEYCSAKFDTNLPTAASIKRHLRVLLRMRLLGAWYNPPEIEALGGRHGFEVEIFGSMVCMYRFHAVLRPR
jgi:hypothetical protein